MSPDLPTEMPDGEMAVVTRGLTKRFGSTVALRDLALQVPLGAVYLLVGPNGAGKSTTIRTLLDLVRADAGSASVFGLDPAAEGSRVRANVGYVPEQAEWGYGNLAVGALLAHHAAYFPSWDSEYASRLVRAFEVNEQRQLGTLSKGQARRVHFVLALAHRPPLLLLDEPTDGLDPVMRDDMLGILADHLATTPTTMLISTHHVAEMEAMADDFGAMRDGALVTQLPMETLRRSLRRYRAEVPEHWSGVRSLNGAVLRRSQSAREVQWTIWGTEAEITAAFTAAGATLRDVAPLSLEDATLALLNPTREVA